jgi:hypothetical protein
MSALCTERREPRDDEEIVGMTVTVWGRNDDGMSIATVNGFEFTLPIGVGADCDAAMVSLCRLLNEFWPAASRLH